MKAKRTRYKKNLLEHLTAGKKLLAVQTGAIDSDSFLEEIEKSFRKINHAAEIFESACEELSIEARNQNRDEEYEQFIEENDSIMTDVFSCISDLDWRIKSVKDLIRSSEKCVEPALEEQVVQLQAQVQQLMIDQQDRQEASGIQGLHHATVNLP